MARAFTFLVIFLFIGLMTSMPVKPAKASWRWETAVGDYCPGGGKRPHAWQCPGNQNRKAHALQKQKQRKRQQQIWEEPHPTQ
jgi:hypothetical protein